METIINNLYSRFFLRDIMGYTLSGSILEYFMLYKYYGDEKIIFNFSSLQIAVYLFVGYLIGICISFVPILCKIFRNKLSLTSVLDKDKSDDKILLTILSENEEVVFQRDRFVSLKEITMKNGISLLICFLINTIWKSSLLDWILIIPGSILLASGYYYRKRQKYFEDIIIDKKNSAI